MVQCSGGLILVVLAVLKMSCSLSTYPPKVILLYTKLAIHDNWFLPGNVANETYFERLHCPATNCVLTSNVTYLPRLQDYDVIVTNSWNVTLSGRLPPTETRSKDQIYVVHYREHPENTEDLPDEISKSTNWTMSYRLDADVSLPYGQFLDKGTHMIVSPSLNPPWRQQMDTEITRDQKVISIVESKTKFAAWFVSRCNRWSNRTFIAMKMQDFVQVDVYGKCGKHKCNKGPNDDCREMVEKDYKFYLAFENALCADYVTEKVFSMMRHYVIPVVYGGADYNRYLPPGSYINVMDYESVEELVEYLKYVAGNTKEYMKYFWWKDFYYIQEHSFCDICEKITRLRDKPYFTKHYNDLNKWFKTGACKSPESVPLVKTLIDQYRNMTITVL